MKRLWTPRSVEYPRRRLRPERMHLFEGRGYLIWPDESVEWVDDDWQPNALHDAGEQDMLQDYLAGQATATKYLALLNDSTVAETDGTMTAVTEAVTTGTNGYARIQVLTTDWTNDGLISGDYRFSAAQKVFGPPTTTGWTLTHVTLCTTATGAGLLLASIAVTGSPLTVPVGTQYGYTFRWTQQ